MSQDSFTNMTHPHQTIAASRGQKQLQNMKQTIVAVNHCCEHFTFKGLYWHVTRQPLMMVSNQHRIEGNPGQLSINSAGKHLSMTYLTNVIGIGIGRGNICSCTDSSMGGRGLLSQTHWCFLKLWHSSLRTVILICTSNIGPKFYEDKFWSHISNQYVMLMF